MHQVLHNARLLLIGLSLAVFPRRIGGSESVSDVAVPLLQLLVRRLTEYIFTGVIKVPNFQGKFLWS